MEAFYRNLGVFGIGCLLKGWFFPLGRPAGAHRPGDDLIRTVGDQIMEPTSVRESLASFTYRCDDPEDAIGRVENTYRKLLEVEPAYLAFLKADGKGELDGETLEERLHVAVAKGVIAGDKVNELLEYDALRYDCLLTDAFDFELKEVKMHTERPV